MGVPAVPLAQLYDGCKQEIERRGGEVNLRTPLRRIVLANGAVEGVEFDGRGKETADAYVFAVPHETLAKFLTDEMRRAEPSLANLDKIKVSPITGVHFWFDRTVMTEPFVTLLETKTQWIFNKTQLYGNSNGSGKTQGQYLQLVISASYEFLQKSRQEIIDVCLAEVCHALPMAKEAKLVKATVIKEAAATFSPQPGVDRWRPKQETNVQGMFVAGDWTATGWPATMEGAVRSGYLAAEAVLRKAGTPRIFLQPDLAPDGLVALFA